MFSFIRVVVVMVTFHSNRNPTETEVDTKDWGIAVIGLTMFCLEEFGLWKFGLGEQ